MGQDGDDVWQRLGQLKCKKCSFVTSEQGLMQAHTCRRPKVIQPDKPFIKYSPSSSKFTCSLCCFHALEHIFVSHLQQHLLSLPFRCVLCPKRFAAVEEIRQHITSFHPSAPGYYSLLVSAKTKHILRNAKVKGKEFFTTSSKAASPLPLLSTSSCNNAGSNHHKNVETVQISTPPLSSISSSDICKLSSKTLMSKTSPSLSSEIPLQPVCVPSLSKVTSNKKDIVSTAGSNHHKNLGTVKISTLSMPDISSPGSCKLLSKLPTNKSSNPLPCDIPLQPVCTPSLSNVTPCKIDCVSTAGSNDHKKVGTVHISSLPMPDISSSGSCKLLPKPLTNKSSNPLPSEIPLQPVCTTSLSKVTLDKNDCVSTAASNHKNVKTVHISTHLLSSVSSCDNGKRFTDKTPINPGQPVCTPLLKSSYSKNECVDTTLPNHIQNVGSVEVSIPPLPSPSCGHNANSSYQCAVISPSNLQESNPLLSSSNVHLYHPQYHADLATLSNLQHASILPSPNVYGTNGFPPYHLVHNSNSFSVQSNPQQPLLQMANSTWKSSLQVAKSTKLNSNFLHTFHNNGTAHHQRRMHPYLNFIPPVPNPFCYQALYPHYYAPIRNVTNTNLQLCQQNVVNEKENYCYNGIVGNSSCPVQTSKHNNVSDDLSSARENSNSEYLLACAERTPRVVQTSKNTTPIGLNAASSQFGYNTAESTRCDPVQVPMVNTPCESEVNSNFEDGQTETSKSSCTLQTLKKTLSGESINTAVTGDNSNSCNDVPYCSTSTDEKLNECISFFYVVNDTCICSRCQERFKNVDFFYQHVHKDLHTLFQQCCPTGFSKNCDLFQTIIHRLNEKSLGQLKYLEFAPNKGPGTASCALAINDKQYNLHEFSQLMKENYASEKKHIKEECMDDLDARDISVAGSCDIKEECMDDLAGSCVVRRHSCVNAHAEKPVTPVLIKKRHSSCDRRQQPLPNTHHEISSNSGADAYADFEAMEHDLVEFCSLLNEQVSKEFFKCAFPKCKFSAHQSINLLIHMESEHGNEEEFVCLYCGFIGDKVTDLVHHITLHNSSESKSYSGSIESGSCDSKPISCVHQNLNSFLCALEKQSEAYQTECSFLCGVCSSRFSSVSKFKTHLETSSLKTYSCKLCCSVYLNSKSFEQHFQEMHPGRSRFSRVIVNFLCHFRKSNYRSFCQILKQYVPRKGSTICPFSPISESSSKPAHPIASASHVDDLLPSKIDTQPPLSCEKMAASPANTFEDNDDTLNSPISSSPSSMVGMSVSGSRVSSPVSGHLTSAGNCSENRQGTTIDLPSKSDAQLTHLSYSDSRVDDAPILSPIVLTNVAIAVTSSPTNDDEGTAATAPVAIENSIDIIESARQTSSADKSILMSVRDDEEPVVTNKKSTSSSSISSNVHSLPFQETYVTSPKRHCFIENTDCDMGGKGGSCCVPQAATEVSEGTRTVYYKCKFCDYQCVWDPEDMMTHLKNSKYHLFYKCYYCPNPYYDQRTLKNHIRFHHGNEPFIFKEFGIEETFVPILETKETSEPQSEKFRKCVQISVLEKTMDLETCPKEIKSGASTHSTTEKKAQLPLKKKTLLNFICKRCRQEFSSVYNVKKHYEGRHKGATVKWIDKNTRNVYSSSGKILGVKDVMKLEPPAKRYLCNLCSYHSEIRSSVHGHQDKKHDLNSSRAKVIKLHGFRAFKEPSRPKESSCSNSNNRNFRESAPQPLDKQPPSPAKTVEIRKNPIYYNCHLCSASLRSEFFLRIHLAKHGGFRYTSTLSPQDGVLICSYCGYIADSNIDLVNHVAGHATDRRYKCSLCNWESHHRISITNHIKKRHKDENETGTILDREERKGKCLKLEVVNINPIVVLKPLEVGDF